MLILDMLVFMVVVFSLNFIIQSFSAGRCLLPVFLPVHPVLSLHRNLPKRSYH